MSQALERTKGLSADEKRAMLARLLAEKGKPPGRSAGQGRTT